MIQERAIKELLSDIENDRIDKSKWIKSDDVIPVIRLSRDVVKYTGDNGGVQYKGFSNLLDFYFHREHISGKQHRAGNKFYRMWHFTILRDRYVKCSYGEHRGDLDFDDLAIIPHEFIQAKMAIDDPMARLAVVDVCCHSISPGRRKMGLVTNGLDDLIKHFS